MFRLLRLAFAVCLFTSIIFPQSKKFGTDSLRVNNYLLVKNSGSNLMVAKSDRIAMPLKPLVIGDTGETVSLSGLNNSSIYMNETNAVVGPYLLMRNSNAAVGVSFINMMRSDTSPTTGDGIGSIFYTYDDDGDGVGDGMALAGGYLANATSMYGGYKVNIYHGGTENEALNIDGTGIFEFNNAELDYDFIFNTLNESNSFVIEGSTGNVGIGVLAPSGVLDVVGGNVFLSAGASAPADGSLSNGQFVFWMDEVNDEMELKWKESGGTVNTLTLGTGGGDFLNGGEAGGAARTLGNTDDQMLGLLSNNAQFLKAKRDTVWQKATTSNPSFVNFSNGMLAWQIDGVNNQIKVNVKDGGGETFQRTLVDNQNLAGFTLVPGDKTVSIAPYLKAAAGDLTACTSIMAADNTNDFTWPLALEFSATVENYASFALQMPSDWDGFTAPSITLVWYSATGHASNTVEWRVKTGYTRPGTDSWVAALGSFVSDTPIPTIANVPYQLELSPTPSGTPNYGAYLRGQISRDGDDATFDTHTATAILVDVLLTYRKEVIGANF